MVLESEGGGGVLSIRRRPRTNGSVRTNCNTLEWGCRPIEISGRSIETSWLCTLY